jgi:hypothetical protein
MGFSFTATARCDKCGEYLSSSDEDCDHNGEPVNTHMFRRLSGEWETVVEVDTTPQWKWYALKETIGDDWIAYQYIGQMENVQNMLGEETLWEGVDDLPAISTSVDSPDGVEEHET